MAPNIKVKEAFRAMKAIGISESQVKPVLKRLLKLYDKNWELIEEENYRVLADAIFEDDDSKHCDDVGEEAEVHDEPEQPLKRSRSRSQDGQPSSFRDNSSPVAFKKPKVEENVLDPILPQYHSKNMGKQPASPIGSGGRTYKGKEPMLHQVSPREKRPIVQRPSQALRIRDTVDEPDIVLKPKQKVPATHSFIIPKDEPYTDDLPDFMAPITVVMPDSSIKVNNSVRRVSAANPDDKEPPASHFGAEEDKDGNLPVKSGVNSQVTSVSEDSPAIMEIASSSLGEERLVNVTPSIDVLKNSAACSTLGGARNCMPGNISNGSVGINPFAALQIQRPLQHFMEGMHPRVNGNINTDGGKELGDPNAHSLAIVPQHQLTSEELRSLYDFNDLSKGEEKVQIAWLNEINNDCPPSFHYIPGNLIFQNACVKFSLSQIKDDFCCSTCVGDCLSSTEICACAACEIGDMFAYTLDGLLREDFLDDCITMTRDPQQQCLSYCKVCPFERSKNDEILEPCKGHLNRRYIKECWSKCACHKQCGNRVVQRGIKHKLQVFFTPEGKGWGLRTLEKLPRGTFICEYVGEILTNKELHERNMQRMRGTNDGKTHPVLLDAYWFLKGSLKDEEALCLDATFYGNVARFINHRCLDANLIEIPVKMESPDNHYYHLAFFTTRDIDAMEELTWDYGIDFDDNDQHIKVFRCLCGSKFCRNMKRSNRSKSLSR